jgi:[acyl-carrier-protein] S-malonyltransferase
MQAILFPGQGSQYVGMGSDFYNKFVIVKKIFESVDKTLGYSLSDIILNGPESELKLTKNTQPAIMALGVSIFNVLKNYSNLNLKNVNFFAGHSLGEYTALVCSGSLTLENAAYLLHERGKAMQQAVPEGHGAMTAVLGMTIEEVENEIKILNTKEVCEVANDNCNGQVVVSGTKEIIATFNENLKKKNKRGIILPVSAPFHCSLMKDASIKMEEKILKTDFAKPIPSIISNVTAKEENNVDTIKSLLIKQIVSRVRWRESVNYMIKTGVTDFIEIGPGKVLSGLIKKIDKTVKVRNINSIEVINN